jgi:hypothetical protein
VTTAQAESFDYCRVADTALAVWAPFAPSSEAGADLVLGEITTTPARGRPAQVTVEIIDVREARKQWQDRVDSVFGPPLEPAPAVTVVPVPQPLSRHRGPRRGHVGAPRRPGGRRVSTSSASSRGDPDLADEPPEHRRAS